MELQLLLNLTPGQHCHQAASRDKHRVPPPDDNTPPCSPLAPAAGHALSSMTSPNNSSLTSAVVWQANNKLMLSTNPSPPCINVSVEVPTTFFEDIQYVHVPVEDAPSSQLYDFF
ncbi:Dual specificity phosphatase 21 [Camelus dromedarius]|uniref:Dual specificity phosphatase 21 n=1 Tax=Camelus dromedarius TaxID=9838 RepID=A0A5N4C3B6_CAMDR|nr:Dual specificity phosphatase 21 [Camelus dromedarius]